VLVVAGEGAMSALEAYAVESIQPCHSPSHQMPETAPARATAHFSMWSSWESSVTRAGGYSGKLANDGRSSLVGDTSKWSADE
jgi:hypothetical protein